MLFQPREVLTTSRIKRQRPILSLNGDFSSPAEPFVELVLLSEAVFPPRCYDTRILVWEWVPEPFILLHPGE